MCCCFFLYLFLFGFLGSLLSGLLASGFAPCRLCGLLASWLSGFLASPVSWLLGFLPGFMASPPNPAVFHPSMLTITAHVTTMFAANEGHADHFVCKRGGGTPPQPPFLKSSMLTAKKPCHQHWATTP